MVLECEISLCNCVRYGNLPGFASICNQNQIWVVRNWWPWLCPYCREVPKACKCKWNIWQDETLMRFFESLLKLLSVICCKYHPRHRDLFGQKWYWDSRETQFSKRVNSRSTKEPLKLQNTILHSRSLVLWPKLLHHGVWYLLPIVFDICPCVLKL